MRGTYNAKGVEVGSSNIIAPAGDYTLKIKRVFDTDKEGNPKVTKNGDPMVSVLCEVNDTGPYLGATVWHNVTFMARNEDGTPKKGAGMALHFLKCIGEPHEEDFDYDTDRWPEKLFRAKVKVSKDMNGLPRNEIAWLIDPDKEQDDEVPF